MNRLSDEKRAALEVALKEGKADPEIARLVGIDPATVARWRKRLSRTPKRYLTLAEEADVIARTRAGDRDARHRLIDSYRGMIIWAAWRMQGRGGIGISIEDLIQEGCLTACLITIRLPEDMTHLAAYLAKSIFRDLREYIDRHQSPIAEPGDVSRRRRRVARALNHAEGDLIARLDREPTLDELLAAADVRREDYERTRQVLTVARLDQVETHVADWLEFTAQASKQQIEDLNIEAQVEALLPGLTAGQILRCVRETLGWSHEELAQRAGLLEVTVRRLEHHIAVYDGEHIQRIAHALAPVCELRSGELRERLAEIWMPPSVQPIRSARSAAVRRGEVGSVRLKQSLMPVLTRALGVG